MEFNQKLQELRKKKGLSQEELADILFISRAAVSKWESGRGLPNIDSLKNIANVFSITVDELLSSDELLCLAEASTKQKENNYRDLTFGLLDFCYLLLLFIPLFSQKTGEYIKSVSLFNLYEISTYIKIVFFAIIILNIIFGVLILALQNYNKALWFNIKSKISLLLNIISVFIFIVSMQPYACAFVFSFLIIKIFILLKTK